MVKRKTLTHIEREEIDFINSLFDEAMPELDRLAAGLQLDAANSVIPLEQLLEAADTVHIDMQVGRYVLHFQPRIETERNQQHHYLALGYPHIVELAGTARSGRVEVGDGTLQASDTSGKLHNVAIENISATGMALTADYSGQKVAPETTLLRMRLRFPDKSSSIVQCVVVNGRRSNGKLALGVKFVRVSRKMKERLDAYLYLRVLAMMPHGLKIPSQHIER